MPPEQAEAIAAAIGRSVMEMAATKADIETVRIALKGEIETVRIALKGEIETVRIALKGDIDAVRHELRADIERGQNKLLTWIMSAMVALGGIIIAVVKL